jgi:hypothetical protein
VWWRDSKFKEKIAQILFYFLLAAFALVMALLLAEPPIA